MNISVTIEPYEENYQLKFPKACESSNVKIYNSNGQLIINEMLRNDNINIHNSLLDNEKYYLMMLTTTTNVLYKVLHFAS